MTPSTSTNLMPEKSVSMVGKFTESKNISVSFPKLTDINGGGEHINQSLSNDSSGSNSMCSSMSNSSIQTQVSTADISY